MSDLVAILETHPEAGELDGLAALAHVLERLDGCIQVCQICADACLAADEVADLRQCIRLDLDCAAICTASASVVGRLAAPSGAVLRTILDACATACEVCAEECGRHAAHHDHCRICAAACRACATACRSMLTGLPS